MPSLSRPIALSRPDAVSTVLGVALPALGRAVTVFGITPPSRSRLKNGAISRTYPNVPDATRTGFLSSRRPRRTRRFTTTFLRRSRALGGAQRPRGHHLVFGAVSPPCEGGGWR